MPWFHVDDRFASHPKVLATSLAARGLWVTAGSWSSAHLTDGVVPDHVLVSLGGTPELAAELVAAGLWKRRSRAHVFHDWTGNGNPTREAVENDRAAAAERQRNFRAKRKRGNPVDNSTAAVTAGQDPSRNGAVTRDSRVSHRSLTSTSYGSTTGRARDPASAARSPGNPKPPWCGECDEVTRLAGDPPARCLRCHPLARTRP